MGCPAGSAADPGRVPGPYLGDIKVAEWHARVTRTRGLEEVTKTKNASPWATHCQPEWGAWPMAAF